MRLETRYEIRSEKQRVKVTRLARLPLRAAAAISVRRYAASGLKHIRACG